MITHSPILTVLALAVAQAVPHAPVSAQAATVEVAAEFQGIWRADDGTLLALEPERAVWIRDDVPAYYRARAVRDTAEPGAVLESWARETRLALDREGGALRVRVVGSFEDAVDYAPAPEAASAVTVRRLTVAETGPLEPEVVERIRAELRRRAEHDQALRKSESAMNDEELGRQMREASERDALYVRELLETVGWIDPARFGKRATDDAFLLVQHASQDLPLMSTVLPLLEAGVAAGDVDGQLFALMHDRLRLSLGYLQRYGSQLGQADDGTLVLMPLEDPAGVDARRAALGMGTLAGYLALFGDVEQIRLPPGLELAR